MKISEKFQIYSTQIDDKLPRLSCVMLTTFTKKFPMALAKFNGESQCKVNYSLDMLFKQLTYFTDKVIKNQ